MTGKLETGLISDLRGTVRFGPIGYDHQFPSAPIDAILLRAEAFDSLHRVRFGTGNTSLQFQNFGRLTSSGGAAE